MVLRHGMLSLAFTLAQASLAFAQNAPASPHATSDVPAMGGKPSALRNPPSIGLQPSEMLVSRLEGAPVQTATPHAMGPTTHALLYANQGKIPQNAAVGKIDDVLVGPHHDHVTAVVLAKSGVAGDKVEIAFSTLQPKDEPTPSFVTSLDPAALAHLPAANAHDQATLLSARDALIGRHVRLENGDDAGTIADIAVERGNGAIDFAILGPTTPHLPQASNLPHAVPWRLVRNFDAPRDQPLTVALNKAQLQESPVFGAVAQQRPADRKIERRSGATVPPP